MKPYRAVHRDDGHPVDRQRLLASRSRHLAWQLPRDTGCADLEWRLSHRLERCDQADQKPAG
jgi:hypothetical protein